GVHIEVHNCPEEALSDGPQALLPEQYAAVAVQIRSLAALLGKQISTVEKEAARPARDRIEVTYRA
ncbi:MAG: hypothetical protein B7Z73_14085, partial [Planctomycetia bacterium 21-64-5]